MAVLGYPVLRIFKGGRTNPKRAHLYPHHPSPPLTQLRFKSRARLFTRDIMKFSFSEIVVLFAVIGAAKSVAVPRDGKLKLAFYIL